MVYSQASNGDIPPESSVSEQTGQYSFKFTLLTVRGTDRADRTCKRDLCLAYSDMSAALGSPDTYGVGWSLTGLSFISPLGNQSMQFSLSNGTQYTLGGMEQNGTVVQFKDQKTRDVLIHYDKTNDSYTVYYKDGVAELLTRGFEEDCYNVSDLYFPSGERFSFTYNDYGRSCLKSVTNYAGNEVLKLEYGGEHLQSASVWRGGDVWAHAYTMVQSNSFTFVMASLSPFAGDGEQRHYINFDYIKQYEDSYFVVAAVRRSNGAKETITHDAGHKYKPSTTETRFVPRVSSYCFLPAPGQTEIVQKYEYDDTEHNFLGYPNPDGYSWSDSDDNIYAWSGPSKYLYGLKVTLDPNGPAPIVNEYTYNTFHLLKRELETVGDKSVETLYTYPCDDQPETLFANQPDNTLFPTTIETIVHDGDLEPHTVNKSTSTFDKWGNNLTSTQLSGMTVEQIYFPPEGSTETDLCPPDPFNFFARFVKETRSYAAPDGDGNSEAKLKQFTYKALPAQECASNTPAAPFTEVVKVTTVELGTMDTSAKKNIEATLEVTYTDDPGSHFKHNKIKVATLNSSSSATVTASLTASFAYTVDAERVTEEMTVSGDDGAAYTTTETTNVVTRLVEKTTNRNDVTSSAMYSPSGDVLSTTSSCTTSHESTTSYEYVDSDPEVGGCSTVVRREASGNVTRIAFDGAGNVISGAIKLPGSDPEQLVEVYKASTDGAGRLASATVTDYHRNGEELFSTTEKYSYDGWGLLCEKRRGNVCQMIQNDVRAMQRTVQSVAKNGNEDIVKMCAPQTTTYNKFQKVASIKEARELGDVETSLEYDLFGRRKQITTPQGRVIGFNSYDLLDRALCVTNPNNVAFNIAYAPMTPSQKVQSLSISTSGESGILGECEYDGIVRRTSRTVAGLTTSFSYAGGKNFPCEVVKPSNNTFSVTYEPGFDMLPFTVETKDVNGGGGVEKTTFTYGDGSDATPYAFLREASKDEENKLKMAYDPSGALCGMTHTQSGESAVSTYQTSLLGETLETKVTSFQGVEVKTEIEYDAFGRECKRTQGNNIIGTSYDELGRKVGETLTVNGVQKQTLSLSLDDACREISRTVEVFNGTSSNTLQIKYTYDVEDKMKTRETTLDDTIVLSETFEYDAVSRLVTYNASSSDNKYLPTVGGVAITCQQFTFDIFNNIETVVTNVVGEDNPDTATYEYTDKTSHRPISITHTLTSVFSEAENFSYNSDGDLVKISSQKGEMSMVYNVLGQMVSVRDESGTEEQFSYDAFQRLTSNGKSFKHYVGPHVVLEEPKEPGITDTVKFVRMGARTVVEDSSSGSTYVASDKWGSAIGNSTDGNGLSLTSYGLYGEASPDTRTGFAGETVEACGMYLLGSGTRAYLPRFQMFCSMDSISPFGGGDINPYLYCGADPANSIDPTGHMDPRADLTLNIFALIVDVALLAVSVVAAPATGGSSIAAAIGIMGSVMGITSDLLGIAADSVVIHDENKGEDNSDKSNKLAFASTITGAVSLAMSVGMGASHTPVKKLSKRKKGRKTIPDERKVPFRKSDEELGRQRKGFVDQFSKTNRDEMSQALRDCLQDQKSTTRKVVGSEFVNSVTGVNFGEFEKALDTSRSSRKRLVSSTLGTAELSGHIVGIVLLKNGTYSLDKSGGGGGGTAVTPPPFSSDDDGDQNQNGADTPMANTDGMHSALFAYMSQMTPLG